MQLTVNDIVGEIVWLHLINNFMIINVNEVIFDDIFEYLMGSEQFLLINWPIVM